MSLPLHHYSPASLAMALLALRLAGGPCAAQAADDAVERAVQAAYKPGGFGEVQLFTPTFQIAGHRFAVPPVRIVEGGGQVYRVSGTLTFQGNDNEGRQPLSFRITKRRGGAPVLRAEYRVDGGAWMSLATPLNQALVRYRTGRTFTAAQQQENRRRVEDAVMRTLDGTWQRAAEFLIARIALGDGC